MTDVTYNFPEKDLFSALEVTHPEFDIMQKQVWSERLYQNFDEVRAPDLFKKIKMELGILENQFKRKPQKYLKALFSGHKGSGKTVELLRFANEMERDSQLPYTVITIRLAEEIEIQRFEPEFLLPIMISALVSKLDSFNIEFNKKKLNQLGEKFTQEKTLVEELTQEYGFEVNGTAEIGFSFWKFLSAKGMLKGIFSRKNKSVEAIKNKVRINQKELIEDFNEMLATLRQELKSYTHHKQDFVFILDDFEKCKREVYQSIFLYDTQLITGLHLHLISSVPINTFYQIEDEYPLSAYSRCYLPMIRITDTSRNILKEMLAKRVELSIIMEDENIIDDFISASGGCVRQLFELLNSALLNAMGNVINQTIASKTIRQKAMDKYSTLRSEHQARLKQGSFNNSDPVVLEMLLARTILEYNGDLRERKINPLLDEFFSN